MWPSSPTPIVLARSLQPPALFPWLPALPARTCRSDGQGPQSLHALLSPAWVRTTRKAPCFLHDQQQHQPPWLRPSSSSSDPACSTLRQLEAYVLFEATPMRVNHSSTMIQSHNFHQKQPLLRWHHHLVHRHHRRRINPNPPQSLKRRRPLSPSFS